MASRWLACTSVEQMRRGLPESDVGVVLPVRSRHAALKRLHAVRAFGPRACASRGEAHVALQSRSKNVGAHFLADAPSPRAALFFHLRKPGESSWAKALLWGWSRIFTNGGFQCSNIAAV